MPPNGPPAFRADPLVTPAPELFIRQGSDLTFIGYEPKDGSASKKRSVPAHNQLSTACLLTTPRPEQAQSRAADR